jgi:hypothetical protein
MLIIVQWKIRQKKKFFAGEAWQVRDAAAQKLKMACN